ncbi:outer membrane usher protein [Enterobacter cloacae complex sp. P15RS]|uniref:outer membrane usher protein n=1 Tax=Enterobacter cloacae complex sp. P15RS TaxID=2779578 RepID=UPI001868FE5E|nr:outer membrane usher protein [Enterobacter cloacae complex sp. P15RS]MBE3468102.1 outer membrane usher protein [Enterobacter cloacae complex sp. P15RS]
MKCGNFYQLKHLAILIGLIMGSSLNDSFAEDAVEFNTQFLDVQGSENYDLSHFSRKGYVLPGKYNLQVIVNKGRLPENYDINWYPKEDEPDDSFACLSPDLVAHLGIKPELTEKFIWIKEGACLKPDQLKDMHVNADMSESALRIAIPQAYLEYSDENWDPPTRWDEGIPGILFDYNINASHEHDENEGGNEQDVSGNGTLGANLGPWRLRADWQADYQHQDGETTRNWEWSRYYAYRALPAWGAQLLMGETSLSSDIFDTFNYAGLSVNSDDQMLPPNLRGYAPDIAGVARTNAKVVVTQQGRVLYEKQVPAGPFRIQDINQSVSGDLHVRIEEQDGKVQEYDVSTTSVPFLTRANQVRFKTTVGRPQDWNHNMAGNIFAASEASWGVADGWSLYGGGIGEQDYQAMAVGIGRDMAALGALSFDVTRSRALITEDQDDDTLQGNSYRISYSKDYDELHSRISFAGYRFSEENFMTMNDYLDAQDGEHFRSGKDKQMFTVNYNQNLIDIGINVFVNWTRRSYWDRSDENNYNIMFSKYFDIGDFRNISLSLNGYRSEYDDETDDGFYLSVNIPWGEGGSFNYNGSYSQDDHSNRVGYSQRVDDNNNYQLSVGDSQSQKSADGYYRHNGDIADLDLNASYLENNYSSVGISLEGGATLTGHGGALHRVSIPGGSRLMIDASGQEGVPVGGYNAPVYTNAFGMAVLSDINDYYRNDIKIDIENLPENAEATRSTAQITLTEGAIGYRQFDIIRGEKAVAILRLSNGKNPPFGAEVFNERHQQVGLVDDNGSVYLAGVNPGEEMQVTWNGDQQCSISLPAPLPKDLFNNLLLPCRSDRELTTPAAPSVMPAIQQQTKRVIPASEQDDFSAKPDPSIQSGENT